jgi:hypothetical protein
MFGCPVAIVSPTAHANSFIRCLTGLRMVDKWAKRKDGVSKRRHKYSSAEQERDEHATSLADRTKASNKKALESVPSHFMCRSYSHAVSRLIWIDRAIADDFSRRTSSSLHADFFGMYSDRLQWDYCSNFRYFSNLKHMPQIRSSVKHDSVMREDSHTRLVSNPNT